MLGFLGLLAACGSSPTPASPSTGNVTTSTVISGTSAATEPSATVPPPQTPPTQAVPPQATPLPAALVGEWSASTAKSGALELVLTADGGFHQYGGPIDWRGTVSVRGARLTFTGTDGKTSTEEWSIKGGTLTLAGITYLRVDAGAGALALAGSWMGLDDIFETLTFTENGTYERSRDNGSAITGTYKVQGSNLTLQPSGGAATTFAFSIDNAILTLRTNAGSVQYTRSS
ncbi:hypothetical protein ACSHWB_41285 [Lentzea sp. HUAS TT2]|uniref:hypothetical protein n=1 Tax=Lentzea sp. HUAS TT2 TaxID=3447454 RepID=UPI003F6FC155